MTNSKTMKKINTRIPGILPPPPKTEIDGKLENLSAKTLPELFELRDRQLKLLNNKHFVNKLADKGEKIQSLLNKILKEIKVKQEDEATCRLFDNLKLSSINKESLQNIEWEGKFKQNQNTYLDSDDDSEPEDVLTILSQNTIQDKKVKILPPEKPLVTPQDIVNIGEVPHIKYIIEKTENNKNQKEKDNFKPYKTTASDVHNPKKEVLRKKHKHWEVTAATPPPIIHGPVKVISIEESLTLQKEQNLHLKQIEVQHAAEKLLARSGIKMAELPDDTSKFGRYRNADSDDSGSDESDPEGSDKEVHDDEPERGGVVFTVMK